MCVRTYKTVCVCHARCYASVCDCFSSFCEINMFFSFYAAAGEGRISPSVVLMVLDCVRWIRDRDGPAGSKQAPFLLRTRKEQAASPVTTTLSTATNTLTRPRTSPTRQSPTRASGMAASTTTALPPSPLSPPARAAQPVGSSSKTTPVRPKSSSAAFSAVRSPLQHASSAQEADASDTGAAVLYSCVCSATLVSQLRAIECVKAVFRGHVAPMKVCCCCCTRCIE